MPTGWLLAPDAKVAARYLESGFVYAISLDHDLGNGPSGYWVASLIEEMTWNYDHRVRELYSVDVHSSNPVGRENIGRCIRRIREFRQRNGWPT